MKTHYHPKNRTNSVYKGKLTFVALLFIVCILLFSFLDGVLIRAATPIWVGQNIVGRSISNFFGLVHSKQVLINENQNLKLKLESEEISLSALQAMQVQNDLLLDTFGRAKNVGHIAATVLSRPPETLFDQIIIDAGENFGVKVGDVVTLPEGIDIGVVIEVFPKSSRVKLISTSGEKTAAVFERGIVPVVLMGRGGGMFEVSVPRDVPVVVGDRVMTAGLGGALLGAVEDVEMTPTDSFKKVLVRSQANIFNLHFVSIRHE